MNKKISSIRLPFHFDRAMLPVIFSLAWPTMLEQFMQTAVQYIDTAMVGTLGTQATAAVGSTGTVNWLIESTISAIGIGFLYYISQSIGAGNILQAKKAAGQAVFFYGSGWYFLYGSDLRMQSSGTGMDAGGSFHSGYGRTIFPDFIFSNAVPYHEYYSGYRTALCRRCQVSYDCRHHHECDQYCAEFPPDLQYPFRVSWQLASHCSWSRMGY